MAQASGRHCAFVEYDAKNRWHVSVYRNESARVSIALAVYENTSISIFFAQTRWPPRSAGVRFRGGRAVPGLALRHSAHLPFNVRGSLRRRLLCRSASNSISFGSGLNRRRGEEHSLDYRRRAQHLLLFASVVRVE